MENQYTNIEDISFLNSQARSLEDFNKLLKENIFSDETKWDNFELNSEINGLMDNINSRMKYSMSKMSLGIYNVLDNGPHKNISRNDELFLFTGFAEIESVNEIGRMIMKNDFSINPALFPNSVHHISLSYYTILKKLNNYTVAINDGLNTNYSFVNFIIDRVKIPENFIVATGEEKSLFFTYDLNQTIDIVPSFTAYKIAPVKSKGFKFLKVFDSIENVINSKIFSDSENVFADKKTFLLLKSKNINKKIYSDFPISKDNPCGIITRLAMPFYFEFKRLSLVLEKIKDKYYAFEVNL